jgi:hypothetical protein
MSRLAIGAAMSAAALALALVVPAFAQDGSGDCDLLTSDEVADVLGSDAPSPMVAQGTCTWMTGTGMVIVGVIPGFGLDAQRGIYPGGVDTTVAGHDAYFVAEAGQIFVDLEGQQLFIAIAGGDTRNAEAILTGLAESAAARVPAQEAPPEGSLASMFPTEIGGQPVIVQQVPEDQVATMMGADPGVREAIETTLAGMGKTMADLEVAFGTAQGGQLFAYRIAGEDAAGFLPLFVGAFLVGNPGGETSVKPIAGKDVTVASAGGQTIAHLYPSGDILWTVIAVEPGLSEILTALP